MSDWGIFGHKRALDLLIRSIARGRVNHAYLFAGLPGIGKTTLALAFAKALACPADEPPCGVCRTCLAIDKGTHPDVKIIQAEAGAADAGDDDGDARPAKSRVIKIEQIKEMQKDASLLPYEARWKIYVIRNAEDLRLDAANRLLKTLEEPPASVVLILTCADANILPATIVSRCQQVNLWPLAASDVAAALIARRKLERTAADELAHISAGRIGWALDTATDVSVIAEREEQLRRIAELAIASRTQRFKYAEELSSAFNKDPEAVYASLDLWLSWWRDLILVRSGCEQLVTNLNMVSRLTEQAMRYSVEQLHGFLVGIETTRRQLEQNVNAKLALEALMLNVPRMRS